MLDAYILDDNYILGVDLPPMTSQNEAYQSVSLHSMDPKHRLCGGRDALAYKVLSRSEG